MYFTIENPYYLYCLFLVPLIIFFHFYGIGKSRGRTVNFANFDAIARIKGIDLYSKNTLIPITDTLFVLAIIFAFSGLSFHVSMDSAEFSYVLAIDSSESMGATDFSPSRLEAAKIASNSFLESAPNAKVAVISFAGNSYLEQELTKDKFDLKSAINNIELTNVGGTDIYEAVSSSNSLLKGEESKAVILLSDGQINTLNIDAVIDFAKQNELVLHTMGVGTLVGGETRFGTSKLDEEALKSLAYNTGGVYFNIQDETAMIEAFSEIVPLTKKMGTIDLESYLFLVAVIIFLVKQYLINVVRVRI